jgi:hypothetical protein
VGLHTDQQSLILGEMMTARNKLQEENQMLRDKLQDAEMMVQLLQLKLSENGAGTDIPKISGRPTYELPNLKNKIGQVFDRKLNQKIAEKGKLKSISHKNAFRNQVAPGKKTFEPKVSRNTISDSPCKIAVVVSKSPKKRSTVQRDLSCSPDSRLAAPEERRGIAYVTTSELMKRPKSTSTKDSNGYAHFFGEEQFPGDAQQMRSVIGKLAQVVLNEYSSTEDDDIIFFE